MDDRDPGKICLHSCLKQRRRGKEIQKIEKELIG